MSSPSGRARSSHQETFSRRALSEFTFQVAIRMAPPRVPSSGATLAALSGAGCVNTNDIDLHAGTIAITLALGREARTPVHVTVQLPILVCEYEIPASLLGIDVHQVVESIVQLHQLEREQGPASIDRKRLRHGPGPII